MNFGFFSSQECCKNGIVKMLLDFKELPNVCSSDGSDGQIQSQKHPKTVDHLQMLIQTMTKSQIFS